MSQEELKWFYTFISEKGLSYYNEVQILWKIIDQKFLWSIAIASNNHDVIKNIHDENILKNILAKTNNSIVKKEILKKLTLTLNELKELFNESFSKSESLVCSDIFAKIKEQDWWDVFLKQIFNKLSSFNLKDDDKNFHSTEHVLKAARNTIDDQSFKEKVYKKYFEKCFWKHNKKLEKIFHTIINKDSANMFLTYVNTDESHFRKDSNRIDYINSDTMFEKIIILKKLLEWYYIDNYKKFDFNQGYASYPLPILKELLSLYDEKNKKIESKKVNKASFNTAIWYIWEWSYTSDINNTRFQTEFIKKTISNLDEFNNASVEVIWKIYKLSIGQKILLITNVNIESIIYNVIISEENIVIRKWKKIIEK